MPNIDALFSPSGGYDYESTLNSGAMGLVLGFGMDPKVHKWLIEDPATSYYERHSPMGRRNLGMPYKFFPSYKQMRKDPQLRKRARHLNILAYKRPSYSQDEWDKGVKSRFEKWDRPDIVKSRKSFSDGVKSGRGLFRATGWMMLMSLGVEVAEQAATPGISKAGLRAEQNMMMAQERPLDSAQTYTMRQRAVNAIHDSLLNTRQVIGNESNFMHR